MMDLAALEERLNYKFKSGELLQQAREFRGG